MNSQKHFGGTEDMWEKYKGVTMIDRGNQYAWQDHLQQMVLEACPIQYLEQFVKEVKS